MDVFSEARLILSLENVIRHGAICAVSKDRCSYNNKVCSCHERISKVVLFIALNTCLIVMVLFNMQLLDARILS
jgi:hypothetical protein